MRLWSLHPQYLDPQGLVALWRDPWTDPDKVAGDALAFVREQLTSHRKAA